FIPGRTIGRRKIDNAAAPYCAKIGASGLTDFWKRSAKKKFTSRSISIVLMLAKQSQTGKQAASRLQILNGRWENCASPRGLSEAIFVAPIHPQVTRVSNSASPRNSITLRSNCQMQSGFAKSI